MRALTITLGAGALLAGCAHPLLDVAATGPGPDKAAPNYRFAAEADPDAPLDKPVLPLIEQRLAAKGLKRQDEGARYVVEVGYTARPLNVGAYKGPAPADKTKEPDWLAAPGKPRWQVSKPESFCAISLRFVDTRTGAEAYRVHAVQQWKEQDCAAVSPHLLDLALADIPLPPAPAKKP
jgi:hypothetical protein